MKTGQTCLLKRYISFITFWLDFLLHAIHARRVRAIALARAYSVRARGVGTIRMDHVYIKKLRATALLGHICAALAALRDPAYVVGWLSFFIHYILFDSPPGTLPSARGSKRAFWPDGPPDFLLLFSCRIREHEPPLSWEIFKGNSG